MEVRRTFVELQCSSVNTCHSLLQWWMQPQRRQIWIKSHSAICRLSYANCVVMPALQWLGNGWRWSCFSRLIAHAFCSNPASPTALWGKRRHEGREREISSPPLFIFGWIFRTHSFSKACLPSSEARLKQLAAKEISTNASWSSSGTEVVISTWLPEVVLRLAHFGGQGFVLYGRRVVFLATLYTVCSGSECSNQALNSRASELDTIWDISIPASWYWLGIYIAPSQTVCFNMFCLIYLQTKH